MGQDSREEIDFEPAGSPGGRNYGWRLREGSIATPTGGVGGPQPPGGVDPVHDYAHGTGDHEGNSVIGGYVYRGPIESLLASVLGAVGVAGLGSRARRPARSGLIRTGRGGMIAAPRRGSSR